MRGEDYGWAASAASRARSNTPSAAGTMLVVCLLGALTRLYQRTTRRERLWLYVQLGLGSFALLLTQTRTAWIALILGARRRPAARRSGAASSSGSRLLSLAGVVLVVVPGRLAVHRAAGSRSTTPTTPRCAGASSRSRWR